MTATAAEPVAAAVDEDPVEPGVEPPAIPEAAEPRPGVAAASWTASWASISLPSSTAGERQRAARCPSARAKRGAIVVAHTRPAPPFPR